MIHRGRGNTGSYSYTTISLPIQDLNNANANRLANKEGGDLMAIHTQRKNEGQLTTAEGERRGLPREGRAL